MSQTVRFAAPWLAMALAVAAGSTVSLGQDGGPPGGPPGAPKQDFPPFAEVIKDFTKVVSTTDGEQPLYTLYIREKDQQLLLELPREFARQKYLFAMTVSTGEAFAGLQGPDLYVYWKRFDKRLALIEPQITVRSTGDAESKTGVDRVFTDRVLLDVPIVCIGPGGGPVIDADALFAQQASRFFGAAAAGANPTLSVIKKAKAFPRNAEIAFEMPTGGGALKTFYYSLNLVPDSSGYQPRVADERVGYFQTWFRDLGKFKDEEKWVRYINRWHVEKAEPKLKLSPPKNPIVFYVEHTVPVRYRRFVRDGALYWNKAFEKVGITDAIEVYFQDKATGSHMDKDPEDARYNFLRWVTNDIATAIGPSRAHPLTGQILDADVVLTDGWIRAFWFQSNEIIPDIVTRGMSDAEVSWMNRNPQWDPRVRLAPAEQREIVAMANLRQEAEKLQRGVARFGGWPAGSQPGNSASDNTTREANLLTLGHTPGRRMTAWDCMAAQGKAFDMSVSRMYFELAEIMNDAEQPDEPADKADDKKSDDKKDAKKEKPDLLDGIPEWFISQALADLTAHEVGHTLGLRHNFKASAAYTSKQVNSEDFKGKKPFATSVMDYNPINVNFDKGLVQGDYNMLNIGAYDMWAIEYGYGFGDPKKVASRAAEPELQFGSDEDAGGIDASIRRYDLFTDPIEYARNRYELAKFARGRILDKFVKEGQSWAKARRGYATTLNMQNDAVSIMTNWVGSAYIRRDRKGDPAGRPPLEVVPAEQQRAALKFVMETAFKDESYGLTPELLKYLTIDRFEDPGAGRGNPDWPIHDQIGGVQAGTLSGLINPVRLARVYDNEMRVPADQDALTVTEMLDSVTDFIFSELKDLSGGTPRKPSITSLRRGLQRELIERLIDLTVSKTPGEAGKLISTLASAKLKDLRTRMDGYLKAGNIDTYTKAHLAEAAKRIDKALDGTYIYNQPAGGLGGFPFGMLFGADGRPIGPASAPSPSGTGTGRSGDNDPGQAIPGEPSMR
jgi:hypothetical protein